MRTWFDNEAILQRVREWLGHTEEELRRLAEPSADDESTAAAEPPPVGLLQLVEAFTALRHELKLQTKSARNLEDSTQAALAGLDRAVEHFRTLQGREAQAAEQAVQPLLMTLTELDEALERGERAFVAIEEQVMRAAAVALEQALQQRFAELSAWQRWRASPWHATVEQVHREHLAGLQQRLLQPLREGYGLIRARLQRSLLEQGISRITCVGLPVDPSRMNVVELVDDPQLPAETVTEELRPGYSWRGRVVRFAEVRAVCRRSAGEQAAHDVL